MGGHGSGRYGGGPTVEASYRLDIDSLLRSNRGIRTVFGRIVFPDGFAVDLEWSVSDPLNAWVCLRFSAEGSAGQLHKVEQRVRLCRTQPHFDGERWWFMCPRRHWQRVRMLYLPPGARHFASKGIDLPMPHSARRPLIGRCGGRARSMQGSEDLTLVLSRGRRRANPNECAGAPTAN